MKRMKHTYFFLLIIRSADTFKWHVESYEVISLQSEIDTYWEFSCFELKERILYSY